MDPSSAGRQWVMGERGERIVPQRSRGQAWKWGIVLVLTSLWLESAVGLDPIMKGIWEESSWIVRRKKKLVKKQPIFSHKFMKIFLRFIKAFLFTFLLHLTHAENTSEPFILHVEWCSLANLDVFLGTGKGVDEARCPCSLHGWRLWYTSPRAGLVCTGSQTRSRRGAPPTLYQFSIHCLLAPDPPFSALMCDPVARCYFEVFLLCPLAKCSLADSRVALLLGSGRPLLPSTPLAQ